MTGNAMMVSAVRLLSAIGLVWVAVSVACGQALEVRLLGCEAPPVLYANNGFRQVPVQRAEALASNRYGFSLAPGPLRFLYVGSSPEETEAVIVGGGESPLLDGHCLNMAGTEVVRSELNRKFRAYRRQIAGFRERQAYLLSARAKATTEASRAALLEQVRELDAEKKALLSAARQADPLLGAYAGLFTYYSHPGLAQADASAESAYFAEHYFDQAKLEDPVFNRIPQVARSFEEYASTLLRLPLGDNARRTRMQAALDRIQPGRPARRLAYAGLLEGLGTEGFDLYAHFAAQLLDEFPGLPPERVETIRRNLAAARALAVGGRAPAFRQPAPSGDEVSLEALRGKVVFVDFWASWCRPCRQENPRLRQIYSSFRGRGFEVVGISLDVSRDRWVGAIEADQIDWLHGSDLLGWENAAARDYKVGAIPHNVLIDREGRIAARNLSMDELQSRLDEML